MPKMPYEAIVYRWRKRYTNDPWQYKVVTADGELLFLGEAKDYEIQQYELHGGIGWLDS